MSASKATSKKQQPCLELQRSVKKTEKWDVYSAGRQNLAAALNDPHHRDLGLFTRTWGEAFVHTTPIPPSTIPVVAKDDFKEYQRRTRQGQRVHARVNRELNLTSLESPQEKTLPCDITVLEQDGRKFDLNIVPRIYFMPSFTLENQKTFSEILPIEDVLGLGESRDHERHDTKKKHKTAPTDKLLHEQLTHYLDMVEVHLAHQIAEKADTFFASMTSHDMFNNEIQALLFHLTEARSNLKRSNRTVARDHLRLLHLSAKRYRCQLVYNKMKVLWAVQQTPPTIKLLLSTMDFVGALELIASTKDALQTELVGVHCVRHLYSELDELEKAIEQMMQDDFASLVLEYVRELMKHQKREGSPAEVASLEERLESVALGLIHQGKLNFMSAVRETLMPWIKSLVRETARRHLRMGEVEGGVEGEDTTKMGDLVRAQEFKDWLTLLENVFRRVMEALKATQAASNFLRSTIRSESVSVPADKVPVPRSVSRSSSQSVHSPVTPSDEEMQAMAGIIGVDYESLARELEAAERMNQLEMEDEVTAAMMKGGDAVATVGTATKQEPTDADLELEKRDGKSVGRSHSMRNGEVMLADGKLSVEDSSRLLSECIELLCAVADFAHGRCTKLLSFRAKAGQLEKLHSNEFTSLVRLIERFVVDTAEITGRQCPSLRAPLLSHSKKFLEQFHDTRKSKLGLLLDSERWKQTDVPPEIQQIVFALESGSGLLPDGPPPAAAVSQQPKEYFVVKGQQFAVVSIVILLIKMMAEYCECATDLPTLAYDVMGKLVDIMTFFNARTCQLVLGAGAVQSIGLKTITARHLGLVYRCLQAIILLIPDLRGYFQRYLSKQHAVLLTQFDRLLQDYQSHCRELAKKLKTIMEDGFIRHLSKWEIKAPIPSNSFRAITKQMVKLHEALVDILPEDQLAGVFGGIEEVLCRHMSQHLNRLGVTNNGSTQHGIVNSELMHFRGTIASLEGLDRFGQSLFDVWTNSN